jgi:MFS family permease
MSRLRLTLPLILREPRLRSVLLIALLAGTVEGMVVPFLALIAEERGVPIGTIGLMAAAFLLAQISLQVPFGVLSDRLGRSWVIVTGLALLSLACVGFSLAGTPLTWILLRILQGFAVAALLPSLRALVADVSTIEQRGEAFAGFNAAFFGGIFGGPLIGGFIIQLAGSRALFLTAALGAVLLAAIVWRGFPEFRRPIVSQHVAHDLPITSGRRALATLLAPPLVGAYLLGAAIQVPGGLATAIWSIYVSDLGGSDIVVGITYSTFSIPLLLLASVAGRTASRRPRWRLLLVTSLLLSVFVAGYGLTDSIAVLIFIGVLEGIVVAFGAPAIDAYMTTIADPRMMGRVQGAFATSGTAGAAVVGWLSAVLYARDHAYPFVFSAVLIVLMVVPAVLLVRRAEERAVTVAILTAAETIA